MIPYPETRSIHIQVLLAALLAVVFSLNCPAGTDMVVKRDVAVPMRDGTILRADVYRPEGPGPFPVLVYRTPYDKHGAERDYTMHLSAVKDGYAVVIEDVRGRYASAGKFDAYRHEGRDGYDTIEWAAKQPWSNGKVGTWGLSYPAAVQWLAAVEHPPHLLAMAPFMTFSSPRDFFYFDGEWDLSWIDWIYFDIAPDQRRRLHLPGPQTDAQVKAGWKARGAAMRNYLPLIDLPDLKKVAPFYYTWLKHPPEDPWWNWAEIRGKYDKVSAAVLNLSGWYDESYGPEGAVTNFHGLMKSRAGQADPKTRLIIGAWQHGVQETGTGKTGDRDFGPNDEINYDQTLLRFFDHYVRGKDNGAEHDPRVRYFVMNENKWHDAKTWPPAGSHPVSYYLASPGVPGMHGQIVFSRRHGGSDATAFISTPSNPVTDPYDAYGPHDYAKLTRRGDVAVFETPPFQKPTEFTGTIDADMFVSCNCRDFDLWVTLLDVDPQGHAWNLMSPGLNNLRASYRDPSKRQLLEPGKVYELHLDRMQTSILLPPGHVLKVMISGTFAPHLSRNLQTGESEVTSSKSKPAAITIYHDAEHASRLVMPVMSN